MTIHFPEEPEQGNAQKAFIQQILFGAIDDPASFCTSFDPDEETLNPGVSPSETPDIPATGLHRVYRLEVDDIVEGDDLSSAVEQDWRCEFQITADCTVDVRFYEDEGKLEIQGVRLEPVPAYSGMEIQTLLSTLDDSGEDYEARYLEIPILYFSALWLSGPQNVLVPLKSIDPALPVGTPVSADELMFGLNKIAERRGEQPKKVSSRVIGC